MDYLFWQLPKEPDLNYFPRIMWTAEIEGVLWAEAQKDACINRGPLDVVGKALPHGIDKCYIDGAWKEHDPYTGQGWVYRKNGSTDTMMGAMSIRTSLSPLHAECEALIWAMECMKTLQVLEVVFATDCSQLVKMVSTPTEWPAFTTHMEEFLRCKEFFLNFTIQHIPRALNTLADKLARGDRTSPSAMVYVDSVSPRWLSDQRSS
ncbi:uncharacterized protein LOC125592528 [Brassica napus]|uniref:uncharacterized protein LOC125592528 n=1 Tax=Brassica napus TaxID=3708 RepID=UPI00207ACAA4|nr:uncharacterized protein LOC125592528 [Brassica napus]